MYRLFFIAACLLTLVACDPIRVYETNQDFDGAMWRAADTAVFKFAIPDTSLSYNVILNFRNSIDFETSRFFLGYSLSDSANSFTRKRLLEYNLFERKSGKPFGDSGLGNIYSHQFLLEQNIVFPSSGFYQVKLNQMMRVDTLEEILSVGIRVEKAAKREQ
jgi:gliding motility-associated lipoprotein GldH